MTAALHEPRPPRVKRWTKREYLDLVQHGAFHGQRVYLFRGDIIEMAPHGHPHAHGIMKLNRYLTTIFPEPFEVRVQLSFVTPGESVPEPDLAVCSGADSKRRPHPDHAGLIVEVSSSSLAQDRSLTEEYAGAQVPEYWIVDTDARRVEVYLRPEPDQAARHGYKYSDQRVLEIGEMIAPTDRPQSAIAIATFFA